MTAHPPTTVGIAIVNWNAGSQLQRCLTSIAESAWETVSLASVVIVDNGSTDGSLDALHVPDWMSLTVVRNPENRGFAAACNQASRQMDADLILFLNPDTVLEAQSIATAATWLTAPEHTATGIVGIQLVDEHGEVSRSCARFPTLRSMVIAALGLDRAVPSLFTSYRMTDWDHLTTRDVDHVIGAFYLVRTSLFRHLHGFDEHFFVYFEDLDFSLRARRDGWHSTYLVTARAFHRGGGTSEQVKSTRLFYSLRSRLFYARKHFTRPAERTVLLCTLVIEPVVRLAVCAATLSFEGMRDTAGAYRRLWSSVRSVS